jgi:hypothetical protein
MKSLPAIFEFIDERSLMTDRIIGKDYSPAIWSTTIFSCAVNKTIARLDEYPCRIFACNGIFIEIYKVLKNIIPRMEPE